MRGHMLVLLLLLVLRLLLTLAPSRVSVVLYSAEKASCRCCRRPARGPPWVKGDGGRSCRRSANKRPAVT